MSERLNGQGIIDQSLVPVDNADNRFIGFETDGNEQFNASYAVVYQVAQAIEEQGGRALLVGGSVRDMVLGNVPKDFDVEVYGLEADRLEVVAQVFGQVSVVGKAFGILKVADGNGFDLDLSLPREDSKIGVGHRGFAVKTNPYMSIHDAAKRRDFTFNSMAFDPLTRELFDPYGGLHDLQAKMLRVTDAERFADDPLRIMRALQFAGRFDLVVDTRSREIMRFMVPQLFELPKERMVEEWRKLLLKSIKPSVGLRLGMELGIFDVLYPEFSQLQYSPQNSEHHPEGDAWTHTLMTVDQAACVVRRERLAEKEAFVLMLAALTHDLGKSATTVIDEDGKITAHGHEDVGVQLANQFLTAVGVDHESSKKVLKLVKYHMWPHLVYAAELSGPSVSNGAFRRLAHKLYPATISELALLAEADHAGRGFFAVHNDASELLLPKSFAEGDWLRSRAESINVVHGKPDDIVQGRDLINQLRLKPGKEFGTVINLCNQLRDDYEFSRERILELLDGVKDVDEAIQRLSEVI
jgi:tRNA nucleotidyltransferase (CCA-adding enzyme)